MSLRAGALGRLFPFFFAFAFTAVFVTPYCGLMFRCGCRQLWNHGSAFCNIYSKTGPHCPFCAHGSSGFYLFTMGSIVVAQFVALFAARRRGMLVSIPVSVAVFLLAGAALAWTEASHDHYLRPSSAPSAHAACAASHDASASADSKRRFDHSILNGLLARYVNDAGWVDYDGLKKDRHLLNRYLEGLGGARAGEFVDHCEQLAFWINGYNAFTLADVLDDVYGKFHGVREASGFFNRKRHLIGTEQLTLDEIEQRGRAINDPRIHFALVCASTSCPKLRRFAYQGRELDSQLDRVAREFFNDPLRGALIEPPDHVLLSPILKWYSGDFSGRRSSLGAFFARVGATVSDHTALDYVAKYATPEMKRWIDEKRPGVHYLDYDWSLNAQSTHQQQSGAPQ